MKSRTQSEAGMKGLPKAAGSGSLAEQMRCNALLGQQDLLREEIKRGKEYLELAQADLRESRRQLEEWPTYERRCGGNCLSSLTETVLSNRRVEVFLIRWLRRRELQLAAVDRAVSRAHT